MAGEFGHVTLDENGPPCACGKRGCWEQYASNAASVRDYLGNGDRSEQGAPIAFADILKLAEGGDARAIETLERTARYLGMGLAGLVMGLAPQVLVIVGEITGVWNLVGPIITDVVTRRSLPLVVPPIVPTDPATQPRLRGAVTLVVQQHFGAPNVA
jgi:predicted NBD/HSP70 family sugar kinase